MKQMGLGIMQYTQDYDEKFPMRYYGGTPNQDIYSWRRTTFPYVKSTQLYSCPSNTYNADFSFDSDDLTKMAAAGLPVGAPRFARSYAINATGNVGGTTPSEYNRAASLSQVTDSSRTILVSEYSYKDTYVAFGDYADADFGRSILGFAGHLGTCNFLFCDGHAKAMKPINTGTPLNMWTTEEDGVGPSRLMLPLAEWQKLVDKS